MTKPVSHTTPLDTPYFTDQTDLLNAIKDFNFTLFISQNPPLQTILDELAKSFFEATVKSQIVYKASFGGTNEFLLLQTLKTIWEVIDDLTTFCTQDVIRFFEITDQNTQQQIFNTFQTKTTEAVKRHINQAVFAKLSSESQNNIKQHGDEELITISQILDQELSPDPGNLFSVFDYSDWQIAKTFYETGQMPSSSKLASFSAMVGRNFDGSELTTSDTAISMSVIATSIVSRPALVIFGLMGFVKNIWEFSNSENTAPPQTLDAYIQEQISGGQFTGAGLSLLAVKGGFSTTGTRQSSLSLRLFSENPLQIGITKNGGYVVNETPISKSSLPSAPTQLANSAPKADSTATISPNSLSTTMSEPLLHAETPATTVAPRVSYSLFDVRFSELPARAHSTVNPNANVLNIKPDTIRFPELWIGDIKFNFPEGPSHPWGLANSALLNEPEEAPVYAEIGGTTSTPTPFSEIFFASGENPKDPIHYTPSDFNALFDIQSNLNLNISENNEIIYYSISGSEKSTASSQAEPSLTIPDDITSIFIATVSLIKKSNRQFPNRSLSIALNFIPHSPADLKIDVVYKNNLPQYTFTILTAEGGKMFSGLCRFLFTDSELENVLKTGELKLEIPDLTLASLNRLYLMWQAEAENKVWDGAPQESVPDLLNRPINIYRILANHLTKIEQEKLLEAQPSRNDLLMSFSNLIQSISDNFDCSFIDPSSAVFEVRQSGSITLENGTILYLKKGHRFSLLPNASTKILITQGRCTEGAIEIETQNGARHSYFLNGYDDLAIENNFVIFGTQANIETRSTIIGNIKVKVGSYTKRHSDGTLEVVSMESIFMPSTYFFEQSTDYDLVITVQNGKYTAVPSNQTTSDPAQTLVLANKGDPQFLPSRSYGSKPKKSPQSDLVIHPDGSLEGFLKQSYQQHPAGTRVILLPGYGVVSAEPHTTIQE